MKHSLGELGVALAATVHALAATPNFRHADQGYVALLTDDVVTGLPPYAEGHLTVPEGPGLGVELDPERVQRYAALYRDEGPSFGLHDPAALASSPALPKS